MSILEGCKLALNPTDCESECKLVDDESEMKACVARHNADRFSYDEDDGDGDDAGYADDDEDDDDEKDPTQLCAGTMQGGVCITNR